MNESKPIENLQELISLVCESGGAARCKLIPGLPEEFILTFSEVKK